MGLLDGAFATTTDDPRFGANMALAAGMIRGDFGGGLLGYGQAMQQGKEAQMVAQLRQAQIAETQAQARERAIRAQREEAELARAATLRQELPGLFKSGGMTGGQAMPQTFAGTDVPQFSKPSGVAPMQLTAGGFDVQRAIALGMTPEQITAYAGLSNIGRPKVARTVKGMGQDGREYEYQVDEFGQRVGDGLAQYRAPISVNQGNRMTFADPYSLKPVGAFQTFQSPDSAASVAVTLRGQNMTDARAREANMAGRLPAGYRLAADGQSLEFIPGGPADPNAAKKAAPTEFQGKAGMFGSRAAEADRIISELDGKYSPAAINAKKALGSVWGVGGALESAGNAALPANAQKAEQAERDFINAVLRLESGAAIGKDEFDNARKQYFPQPFDSDAVKLQKAANRRRAIAGLEANARATTPMSVNSGGATGDFGDGWSIQKVN